MRLIDADALSAFVGDLRSTLHKEQSTFKAMTEIEFNTRDYMLLNFQYAIDNAPTVEYPEQITVECDTEEDKQKLLSALRNARVTRVVEEERPQGEWLTHRVAFHLTCPFCGCNLRALKDKVFEGDYDYNFCPNCGADMRGGKQ